MFTSNGIDIYDAKIQPTVFESEEYRKIVEIITSHGFTQKVDLEADFGHIVTCQTCGAMPNGTNQELHVAHQLLVAGIGDKVDVLQKTAKDAKDRGDIGKEGGVEAEDYLAQRAHIIKNPETLWT